MITADILAVVKSITKASEGGGSGGSGLFYYKQRQTATSHEFLLALEAKFKGQLGNTRS